MVRPKDLNMWHGVIDLLPLNPRGLLDPSIILMHSQFYEVLKTSFNNNELEAKTTHDY